MARARGARGGAQPGDAPGTRRREARRGLPIELGDDDGAFATVGLGSVHRQRVSRGRATPCGRTCARLAPPKRRPHCKPLKTARQQPRRCSKPGRGAAACSGGHADPAKLKLDSLRLPRSRRKRLGPRQRHPAELGSPRDLSSAPPRVEPEPFDREVGPGARSIPAPAPQSNRECELHIPSRPPFSPFIWMRREDVANLEGRGATREGGKRRALETKQNSVNRPSGGAGASAGGCRDRSAPCFSLANRAEPQILALCHALQHL